MLAQVFEVGLERGMLMSQPERTRRNCRMMIEQVDRLVALADMFSDIALVIGGKLKLDLQSADLRLVVSEAVRQLEDRATVVQVPFKKSIDWSEATPRSQHPVALPEPV